MKFKFGISIIFKNTMSTVNLIEPKQKIEIREIKAEEIKSVIPQIREMNETKIQQFEKRINIKGDSCFVGYIENKPVHFSWVRNHGFMHISSVERSCKISQNEVWIFDCRTNESYRGYGIYPAVISRLSQLYLKNKSAVFIDTSVSNKSSIKGILKAGFTPVRKIYRLGLFSIAVPSQLK